MRSLPEVARIHGEQGYRDHFLRQDSRNFAALVGLGIVFNCLLIKADGLFLRLSWLSWGLLALRLGLIGLSAMTLAIILRTDDPARFDRWCFIWSLACVLLNTLVILTRPAAYTDHVIVDLFIIIAFYTIQPGPTLRRVLPPFLLTLGSLTLFFAIKISIGFVATLLTVSTYVTANIVGLTISTTWHRYRKASFAASQTLARLYREAEDGRLAAQSAEQTWERIIDALPNLLFVLDRQYRIRRVNQAALERLGLTRAEVLGRHCYRLICGHPSPPDFCLQPQIQADRQAHNLEARLALLDCECRIMAAPLFDQEGGYEATIYIVQDISVQKRSQRELFLAKEQYRSLVENSHGVIYTLSPDGRVSYVSPSYTRLLGIDPAVIVGKDYRSCIHPDDIATCEAFQKEIETTGKVQRNLEYRVFHRDGSVRWHVSNLIPCFNEDQEIVSYVGNAMDITDQKQHQQELDSARRAAEDSSKVKSEFLALISHEIRTPLNALVGFSSLARKAADPGAVRQYLDIIDQSSRLLMDLVNDILDLSKIEAGRLSLDICSFNLTDTIDVLVWQNGPLAAQKGLEFQVIKDEGVPGWIKGDPMRLRQILANLIANAIKFTPSGKVTLTVTATANVGTPCCLVRFEVRDTGIGIADDKQALLFQPFHQLDPSITRRFGGTGLGLAIVQRLVTLMKGSVEVTSAKGQGSCFTVELPFVVSGPPAYPTLANGDSSTLDILVVEDNAFNRLLLSNTLAAWHHRVTPAENGRQALELTEQFRYHLVIMDIRMPDLDGIGLTRCIRQRERERNLAPVPIIAYTADTEEETREQCLAVGMEVVLYKPFDPEQLALAIGKYGAPAVPTDPAGKALGPDSGLADRVIVDMGQDSAQLQMYLQFLRNDIEEELLRLDRAVATEDRTTLKVAAHSLKGLCGNLRDPLPGELAHQLHQGAERIPFASLRPMADRLRSICARNAAAH